MCCDDSYHDHWDDTDLYYPTKLYCESCDCSSDDADIERIESNEDARDVALLCSDCRKKLLCEFCCSANLPTFLTDAAERVCIGCAPAMGDWSEMELDALNRAIRGEDQPVGGAA